MNHLSKTQIKWIRSLQQKKFRDAEGVFVAEGAKCVEELRDAFELVVLVTPDNATAMEIDQMSSLRTPQGVIGVFRKRILDDGYRLSNKGLMVALDGVQDPGNLGTIIRTCDWFGVHDILCSRETADCYNQKVVQATMGSLARVRVHYVEDLASELQALQSTGRPIYGTMLEGRSMYEQGAIADKANGIIVMGNEGNGLTHSVRSIVTHPLLIPPFGGQGESLNVSIATAIVLAEFRRPTYFIN